MNYHMRREIRIPLILFGISAVIRFIYLFQISKTPFFPPVILDPASYHNWAQSILTDSWIGKEVFYQSPLYSYLLAGFYQVFGNSFAVVRVAQILASAFIPVLVYLISKEHFPRSVSVISGMMAALCSSLFFKDPLGDKTLLVVFLTTLTMLLIVRAERTGRIRLWFLSGIMVGFTAMGRETILLFAAAVVLFLLITRRWKKALPICAGIVLTIAPVTIRNYIVTKDFVLITSQAGQNFYIGNNPEATATYKSPSFVRPQPKYERKDFAEWAEKETGKKSRPSEISRFYFRESMRFIRQHPGQELRLLGNKLLLIWNRYEIPDNYHYSFVKLFVPILRFPFITFGVISPLSILGLALSIRRRRKYVILYLAIFCYVVGILCFFLVARYRTPVIPLLIPFASYAIVSILRHIRDKRYLLRVIPALIVLAVVTNLPLSALSIRYDFATDYHMMGYAYKEQGELRQATKAWEKTLQIDRNYRPARFHLEKAMKELRVIELQQGNQNSPEVLLRLGEAHKDAGQLDAALGVLRKACHLAPNNADAHNTLGLYLAMLFDSLEQSVVYFEKARDIAPDNPEIRGNLGSAYYKLGRTREAFREWEKALELDPDHSTLKAMVERLREVRD
jgi:tetratricopeptide (TPR) repeat protein